MSLRSITTNSLDKRPLFEMHDLSSLSWWRLDCFDHLDFALVEARVETWLGGAHARRMLSA